MSFSDFALALRWFGALWILGWLVLPVSRRLFPRLPDAGLSAGRVLFLLFATLLCFWGAALRLLPLKFSPAIFLLLAIAAGVGWRGKLMRDWARSNWRALLFSDAVFAATWAFFLWIRLCHPEVGDLEKPMDMALIGAAMRADWLPFQNPWYSGTLFTNYYYFGHLIAGLLSRTLFTAPHLAYNLVQPAFCAFFLSVLWSVGAALSRSLKGGLAVMLLVGLGGHYEPLRQIAETKKLWPLDWWKTSRVIPDTINEYPAFTLGVGDMHAHFFALSFAVLWFALLLQFFGASARRYRATMVVCGLMLGAWVMTNTWDAPLFSLLFLLVVGAAAFLSKGDGAKENPFADIGWLVVPFVLAFVVSRPYFSQFKSQVSGVVREPWRPDLFSLWLLWGGWWTLGCIAWLIPKEKIAVSPERALRLCLIGVGFLALIAPYLFYIKGYFGEGPLRHQDTVFKFGLQAWVLLGTGIASELFARLRALWHEEKTKAVTRIAFATLAPGLALVFALAPACVFWMRAHEMGSGPWSLNGMKFLPQADQNAILWLQTQAPSQSVVLEGVVLDNNKNPIGDYDASCGRIGTFSGLPTPLGWPQHVWMWGADYGQAMDRGRRIANIYDTRDFRAAKNEFGAKYVFFGAREGAIPPEIEQTLKPQKFDGADGTQAAIGVLD